MVKVASGQNSCDMIGDAAMSRKLGKNIDVLFCSGTFCVGMNIICKENDTKCVCKRARGKIVKERGRIPYTGSDLAGVTHKRHISGGREKEKNFTTRRRARDEARGRARAHAPRSSDVPESVGAESQQRAPHDRALWSTTRERGERK